MRGAFLKKAPRRLFGPVNQRQSNKRAWSQEKDNQLQSVFPFNQENAAATMDTKASPRLLSGQDGLSLLR